ncbi:MAG: helix-turn-helix domain-containing protein [Sedimentisphaerales bacterium]|nr:helix-turn-helix domain-containing protein [Sedimentisphaerales bacterium]
MGYAHLSIDEREMILKMQTQQASLQAIGDRLGRPKGMNFRTVLKTEIDRVLKLLNNRPRKCLNYRTPTEVFWGKSKRCASD